MVYCYVLERVPSEGIDSDVAMRNSTVLSGSTRYFLLVAVLDVAWHVFLGASFRLLDACGCLEVLVLWQH